MEKMNIVGRLENPAPDSIYEKIKEGFTFDLNRIKETYQQLEKDGTQGYVFALGFSQANFLVVPIQLVKKPTKLDAIVIDGKLFEYLNAYPTEFQTIDEVVIRAKRWLDNWEILKGKYFLVPTIIAPSTKGWIWCTSHNKYIPKMIVDRIEWNIPGAPENRPLF